MTLSAIIDAPSYRAARSTIEPITAFVGVFEFLSSSAITPFIEIDKRGTAVGYLSLDHYLNARLALRAVDARWVRASETAGEARDRGRQIDLHDDWRSRQLDIVATGNRLKFKLPNSKLGIALLHTGDRLLIEGNFLDDDPKENIFWGMARDDEASRWCGRNWMGALLMLRRAELRAKQAQRVYATGMNTASDTGCHR